MSFEIIDLVKEMDLKDIGVQLGLQCAPLLSRMKASNLYTLPSGKLRELSAILKKTACAFRLVCVKDGRAVVLIYREAELLSYLEEEEVAAYLRELGYEDLSLSSILSVFAKRYMKYMDTKRDFPHEMGVLLGYPLADVKGFVKHRGKNFLYCGYWKVYEEPEKKIRLFRRFERAQAEIVKLLHAGMEIPEIEAYYSFINQSRRGESNFQTVVCAS